MAVRVGGLVAGAGAGCSFTLAFLALVCFLRELAPLSAACFYAAYSKSSASIAASAAERKAEYTAATLSAHFLISASLG